MNDWSIYTNRDTRELLELIKKRDQDSYKEEAHAAFYAFYFRFSPLLIKESEIICDRWNLLKEDAIEIVERTFKRFLKYFKNFDISKSSSNDFDLAVLLYLNKIARNVLVDYYKEKKGYKSSPYTGDEAIIFNIPESEFILNNEGFKDTLTHSQIVMLALSKLSDKHKIVYLTYSAYQQNGYKMPRKLLNELRKELKLKQATIQSYKKECIDKINEYLELYEVK